MSLYGLAFLLRWMLKERLRARSLLPWIAAVIALSGLVITWSFAEPILLRPLPYDSERNLISVSFETPRSANRDLVSFQDFVSWAERSSPLATIAAAQSVNWECRVTGDQVRPFRVTRVTESFFDAIGVRPVGRAFSKFDFSAKSPSVALVSSELRFKDQSGSSAIGESIDCGDGPLLIVGVLPANFAYPIDSSPPAGLYVPFLQTDTEREKASLGRQYNMSVVGRLAPAVTIEAARKHFEAITAQLSLASPRFYLDRKVRVDRLRDFIFADTKKWVALVLGAATGAVFLVVMSIAAQAAVSVIRRSEALRLAEALGARLSDIRLAHAMEAVVASTTASSAALFVAWIGIQYVRAHLPWEVPGATQALLDWRVATGLVGAGAVTGLASSCLAQRFLEQNSRAALLFGGRSAEWRDPRTRRWLNLIVGVEIAFVVPVVACSSMFIRSYYAVSESDLGFDTNSVVMVEVSLAQVESPVGLNLASGSKSRLPDRLVAIPSVEAIAQVSGGLPLSGSSSGAILGTPMTPEAVSRVEIRSVSEGFFSVMRLRFLEGGPFGSDLSPMAEGIILDELAAATIAAHRRSVLGMEVTIGGARRRIVGVVKQSRFFGPELSPRPMAYLPLGGDDSSAKPAFVVRTRSKVAFQRQLQNALGAKWRLERVTGLRERIVTLLARRASIAAAITALGLLGAFAAASAILGAVSFSTASRAPALSVMSALGANQTRLVVGLTNHLAIIALMGSAVGLVLALGIRSLVAPVLVEPIAFEHFSALAAAGATWAAFTALATLLTIRAARSALRTLPK